MSSLPNGKTLAQVVSDARDEIRDFAQTRFELLKTELSQKAKLLKIAALLAVIAAALLSTAYLLFTVALVALIAAVFPDNPFRWVFAVLAIGVSWAVLGGIAAYFAKREFALKGITPRRTIAVLKSDKLWIESEAKKAA